MAKFTAHRSCISAEEYYLSHPDRPVMYCGMTKNQYVMDIYALVYLRDPPTEQEPMEDEEPCAVCTLVRHMESNNGR
jgi:hypothetical protein